MGYYSSVGIALSKNAASCLMKKAQRITEQTERYLYDHPDRHEIDKESGDELWLWSSVKWYDGYPEVDLFMNFLNEIDEDDFVFIRVGESYDDIERRGCYWDNVYGLDVETSIVTSK